MFGKVHNLLQHHFFLIPFVKLINLSAVSWSVSWRGEWRMKTWIGRRGARTALYPILIRMNNYRRSITFRGESPSSLRSFLFTSFAQPALFHFEHSKFPPRAKRQSIIVRKVNERSTQAPAVLEGFSPIGRWIRSQCHRRYFTRTSREKNH